MKYKDREPMDLNTMAEIVRSGQRIPKKQWLNVLKTAYKHLSKEQVGSIIMLVEKMLKAKIKGENLTVAFRDWNQDGTRRF
jgi:hypothetical protein